jgi:hypothetical protein
MLWQAKHPLVKTDWMVYKKLKALNSEGTQLVRVQEPKYIPITQ